MTLDEAIKYEKESLQHCKRMLEEIYEDNLQNKLLTFEVKQHEQLAEWLEDYKHIKQWKSDVMDGFCRYDASSFEELVDNIRNKSINDFVKEYKSCDNRSIQCKKFLNCADCIAEQLKAGITNG